MFTYKERAIWAYALAIVIGLLSFFFPNYLSLIQTLLLLILGALYEIANIIQRKK
ncbi:MAG: hypothetical protein Q7S74_03165 [Nanoarchaeota archaeon]|nr:hypothetical protein [Nanoarchaeota archaeon]